VGVGGAGHPAPGMNLYTAVPRRKSGEFAGLMVNGVNGAEGSALLREAPGAWFSGILG
jgi:hypothetical protein